MAVAAENANYRVEDGQLLAAAYDAFEDGQDIPAVSERLVSILVGPDEEARDLLRDWRRQIPGLMAGAGLTTRQRMTLQRRRMFLRNRRVVAGYELLDRELRARLTGGGASPPPTWLTVGKWTAAAIGDLLDERSSTPFPPQGRTVRRVLHAVLKYPMTWRTVPMGRLLVLGNREIFSQVASVITNFLAIDFGRRNLRYASFVGAYGQRLLGQNRPDVADELLFPIRAMTRDPLSDSLLRAMHAYYRAVDEEGQLARETWVLVGNLYLAAYEQLVAQTFVELAFSLRPRRALRTLLADLDAKQRRTRGAWGDDRQPNTPTPKAAAADSARPIDMMVEPGLFTRTSDLLAASFATRFLLAVGIGRQPGRAATPGPYTMVIAPGIPLRGVEPAAIDAALAGGGSPFEELVRVWYSLDRANGRSAGCRVRDWRNYSARVSFIANLFIQAHQMRDVFSSPVFDEAAQNQYLRGLLPLADGIRLKPEQEARVISALRKSQSTTAGTRPPEVEAT